MSASTSIPPGSRAPRAIQTVGMVSRQRPYLERLRRKHGSMFTIRILGLGDLASGDGHRPPVLLERFTLVPTSAPPEAWASRGVAMAPAKGGRVTLERRN